VELLHCNGYEGQSEMTRTWLEYRLVDDESCIITHQRIPHSPNWGQCAVAIFLVTTWWMQQTSLSGLYALTHGHCCAVYCVGTSNHAVMAVPWLRSLVKGLSPLRLGFAPRSIDVGFMVDKVALGQVFLRVFRFSFHRPPNSYLGNA
jgi:hypothetical protein